MKRLLKILLKSVVGIVLSVLLPAAVIWRWPGLVVNSATIPFLLRQIPGVGISYRTVSGHARSVSFLRKAVLLETTGVCAETADLFRVCGDKLAMDVEVTIGSPLTFRVERLELVRGDVRVRVPVDSEKKEAAKDPESLLPRPPEFLSRVGIGRLRLDVPKADIAWDGGAVVGSLDLAADGRGARLGLNFGSDVTLRLGTDSHRIGASVDLTSIGTQWFGPYQGSLRLRARGPGRELHIDGTVKAAGEAGKALGFHVSARGHEGKRKVRAQLEGVGDIARWDVNLSGVATDLTPELPAVEVQRCHVELNNIGAAERQLSSPKPATLDVACGLLLTSSFLSEVSGPKRRFVQGILRRIPVQLSLAAKVVDEKTGRLEGKVASVADKFLRGSGQGTLRADVEFSGVPREFPKGWKATASGGLGIASFQKLVAWLRAQPWAIPEPFASLSGSVDLTTAPEANLLGERATIPLVLRTRLRSPEQSFEVDGKGKLELEKDGEKTRTHLHMNVNLTDVKLVLPRFAMEPPPAMFPDSRIQHTVTADGAVARLRREEEDPDAFDYDITVATSAGQPLHLVTDLAQAPLPLHLSLRLKTGQAPQGHIHVGDTPAMFFGHRAALKRLDLKLGRGPELTEINAEVQVYYAEYTVRVLVNGLAEAPKIMFLSDPPLSENQVIAVLLFGKKMESLDPDQARSASDMKSGIADGAVTLASMYLLASTPVESIGYDPATRVFSARIRLADGTSLNVNSSTQELKQLSLRHRLGKGWAITTYLTNPLDPLTRSLTAFLEWSRGY